jgi:hypothetical protein
MSGGVMGAVEDTRKILQDFLAPELREIKVRLDLLEKRVDGVDHKVDTLTEKLDLLDRRSEQRHEVVMMALGRLVDYTEVRERLARLEGQQHPQ